MTKKQHYMSRDERYKLEALLEAKIPVSRIAKQLGFCRQTIYNEIKRGKYIHTCEWWDEERYSADKAQQIHAYNQTAKGRPLKIGRDHAYAKFLENKMLGVQEDGRIDKRKRYSPAAALAEARKAGFALTVCVGTLYSYIDKRVFLHLTNKDSWEKGKPKKQNYQPVRRIAHPALPGITDRPEHVSQREEYGHWEIDLVVGKAKTKPVLLTLAERRSREPMIFKLPDKRAASVRKIFDTLERTQPDFREKFKTITTDNGPEFLEYEQLTQSIHGGRRFEVYYFGVQAVSAGDGDIAVNINPALEIFAIEEQSCQPVSMPAAEADQGVFMERPSGQVGGKGGLAGAGDAEVDIEHMRMRGTEKGPQKQRQIEQNYKN